MATSGVARHIFETRQLAHPLPKNGVLPRIFFKFCIAVGEFWYIFAERKQTSLSPKTEVWGIIPGKFLNSALL